MPKARFTYTQGSLVVYTKRTLESRGTDLLEFIFANTADVSSCENGCCAENPKSSLLWADFICHIYFLWDRDTSHFHIGLDRLDDAAIRHNCIFSGCRKHELVYAKPKNLKELVEKLDEESDAYTDVEHDSNECIPRRVKECWFCGLADERTNNPTLKVLCLEDIDFWILRDPGGNDGRDRLAMQILLRCIKARTSRSSRHGIPSSKRIFLCSVLCLTYSPRHCRKGLLITTATKRELTLFSTPSLISHPSKFDGSGSGCIGPCPGRPSMR